jgi:hypothetical protein
MKRPSICRGIMGITTRRWRLSVVSVVMMGLAGSAFLSGCRREGGSVAGKDTGASPGPTAAAAHTPPVATATTSAASPLAAVPGLEENRFDSVVRDIVERDDPIVDGWSSEKFNETADLQLKKLGEWLVAGASGPAPEGLVASEFRSAPLRPEKLEPTYAHASLKVLRGAVDPAAAEGGFAAAFRGLSEALAGLGDVRFKFKTVRIEPDETLPVTRTLSYFQVSGAAPERAVQINAMWKAVWQSKSDPPLLETIVVSDYEEVIHTLDSGRRLFSESTNSVFRNGDLLARHLSHGLDHWSDRFDGAITRPAAGHGIAIGDVNNDGLDDLYVCQPPALPNLLLIQKEDGTVVDQAKEAGVNWLDESRSALLNDLDNDGDEDLVVVLGNRIVLHANDGSGRFEVKKVIDTPSSLFSINAVDYDNDRDLDLFFCAYTLATGINHDDVFANPVPFQDANNGAPNIMLRNDGDWTFVEVTNEIGLGQNNMRFSYASSWDDFDGDGDLDLYVANDFGRKNLYRNNGGTFTDVAAELGVEDIGPGMSAAWGDYNNDGHADIYVSNMFSSAGNRITNNPQFKVALREEEKTDFRRHARGNTLFRNNGDSSFTDVSVELGVTLGRWAWGSLFADFNNDGWQDIYVTNGFITADGKDRDL